MSIGLYSKYKKAKIEIKCTENRTDLMLVDDKLFLLQCVDVVHLITSLIVMELYKRRIQSRSKRDKAFRIEGVVEIRVCDSANCTSSILFSILLFQ
jgi:hypothetical protein